MANFRNRMIYRDNRVPFYQKLYQANDGVRQWWKVSYIDYVYFCHVVEWLFMISLFPFVPCFSCPAPRFPTLLGYT